MPSLGEDEVVRADQASPSVRQRLVNHDLRAPRIELPVHDQLIAWRATVRHRGNDLRRSGGHDLAVG
jgi:hypothetical protein